jgi:hypothetical protein
MCTHRHTHTHKHTHTQTHTHMLSHDAQKKMQAGRQERGVSVRRMHIKREGERHRLGERHGNPPTLKPHTSIPLPTCLVWPFSPLLLSFLQQPHVQMPLHHASPGPHPHLHGPTLILSPGTEREREGGREGEREREGGRGGGEGGERERYREKDTERETRTETERDRQRKTEKERSTHLRWSAG